MQVLGIIPARAGSKRLPRKNVRRLGGKPLVAWSIEAALAARGVSQWVVSSDDPEVLAIAGSYASNLPLERPAALADDQSPAIDYVRHALQTLEAPGRHFDAIVIVQPSSPLTLPEDIDSTVELLISSQADTAVSMMPLDHAIHPIKLKRMEGDRVLPYLEEEAGRMAAHELPSLFIRNCSVYATRRTVIEAGQIIGSDCRGYVMPRERSVDINDEYDFHFAEFLMQKGRPSGR